MFVVGFEVGVPELLMFRVGRREEAVFVSRCLFSLPRVSRTAVMTVLSGAAADFVSEFWFEFAGAGAVMGAWFVLGVEWLVWSIELRLVRWVLML